MVAPFLQLVRMESINLYQFTSNISNEAPFPSQGQCMEIEKGMEAETGY